MAFVTVDDADLIQPVSSKTGADAGRINEPFLNDGSTATPSGNEFRGGQLKGIRLQHDVGVDPSTLGSLSVRFFWSEQMAAGDAEMYPHDAATTVATGEEIEINVSGAGAWFQWDATDEFIAQLVDVGTNELAIRLIGSDSVIRGRSSEVEIEFEAGGVPTLNQDGFRFYDDDAAVGSETPLDAEDTNVTRSKESPFRLRVQVDATDDPDASAMTLQYKEVADGAAEWRDVPLP